MGFLQVFLKFDFKVLASARRDENATAVYVVFDQTNCYR
jgi:hypothetical protein